MEPALLLAAVLWSGGKGGVEISVEADSAAIDPARSVEISLVVKSPPGRKAEPPDIRPRLRGFSLADFYEEAPSSGKDGSATRTVRWRLRPEPCAPKYSVAPFVVEVEGGEPFVAGPVRFDPPADRGKVEGGIEISPEKDLPPFSWSLVGWCLAALAAAAAIASGAYFAARWFARRVKEHFLSPIERARAELSRLVKRGLPGRGRFKDFYVELTMVVRRYVQRKYGIKAPHMTTGEFFAAAAEIAPGAAGHGLREFLESADLVKFAGVDATGEMADDATESARSYLEADSMESGT